MFKIIFENNISYSNQVYDHIIFLIESGAITTNDKLISIRKMASLNNVSRCHIEIAYNNLVCDGYIKSIPQKGFYVVDYIS